jgi:hypothetical protein
MSRRADVLREYRADRRQIEVDAVEVRMPSRHRDRRPALDATDVGETPVISPLETLGDGGGGVETEARHGAEKFTQLSRIAVESVEVLAARLGFILRQSGP